MKRYIDRLHKLFLVHKQLNLNRGRVPILKQNMLFVSILFGLNSNLVYAVDPFSELDTYDIKTGILYDKVKVPISRIEEADGKVLKSPLTRTHFRDIYSELYHANIDKEKNDLTDYISLRKKAKLALRYNIFPIGIINFDYNTIKKDRVGLKRGKVVRLSKKGSIYNQHHVFATSLLATTKYTGLSIEFDFSNKYYVSNLPERPQYYKVDFGDKKGTKIVKTNSRIKIHYSTPGKKNIKIQAFYKKNSYKSSFSFTVQQKVGVPSESWGKDENRKYKSTLKFNRKSAVGQVDIYLGKGNSALTRPVVIVDGFDPAVKGKQSRNLQDLKVLVNKEGMTDELIAKGYDLVLVDFNVGDDYIERNAMLVVQVLNDINARMRRARTAKDANQIVVIGPSMGGLVTKYALKYMERNHIKHNVRSWIAFDSPMQGANIPLGLQHWLEFFAEDVEDSAAQEALEQLKGPAAKEMLIYHYGSTRSPSWQDIIDSLENHRFPYDSANANRLAHPILTMSYPMEPRKVSIVNGSGFGRTQGFNAGEQIVKYEHDSIEVDLIGNIWAVPKKGASKKIFNGHYNPNMFAALAGYDVPDDADNSISVNNTKDYDGAPGGSRGSMKTLGDSDTEHGNIIALHNNHAFIPTISGLDVRKIRGRRDIKITPTMNLDSYGKDSIVTPFDKIYYPRENQKHVTITRQSKEWFINEIVNFAPVIISKPVKNMVPGQNYNYKIVAKDRNDWNTLTYTILNKPNWLHYNSSTQTLSGVAPKSRVKIYPITGVVDNYLVKIKVSDTLDDSTTQTFNIAVKTGGVVVSPCTSRAEGCIKRRPIPIEIKPMPIEIKPPLVK